MWRDDVVGQASDLQSLDQGFDTWLGTAVQSHWASYSHLHMSVTKQYNSVLVKGGRAL